MHGFCDKKRFMLKMQSRLPFKYIEKSEVTRHVIDEDFSIMDIREWNRKFVKYPIQPFDAGEE